MKKIIGIIFISLMFCNIGFAEMKLIEEKTVKGSEGAHFYMATVCVDGYKFVITGLKASERNMVQSFEFSSGKSLPVMCWID